MSKRILISTLVALVVLLSLAPVVGATAPKSISGARAHVATTQPAVFCNAPTWNLASNSGWVDTTDDSVFIYAQVWYLKDATNGNFCQQVRSKGGLWFRASYTTCRNVNYLDLDQEQFPWHLLDEVTRTNICGANGYQYQFWGNAVSSCGVTLFGAFIHLNVGNGAYSGNGSTPSC